MSTEDVSTESVSAAYTDLAYRRLRSVKDSFHPGNLFSLNHNIPPTTKDQS